MWKILPAIACRRQSRDIPVDRELAVQFLRSSWVPSLAEISIAA
jgi:hypothetical protein